MIELKKIQILNTVLNHCGIFRRIIMTRTPMEEIRIHNQNNQMLRIDNYIMAVKKLTNTAKLPTKAHETDAGWDLYADIERPVIIPTNGLTTIDTGIAMAIPEGYCGQIWDRSSYGVNGTTKLAGVIDSSYRASVKVVLYSFRGRIINPGDKFAQMLIVPVPKIEIVEVEDLDETTRGEGGFGSSGN